MLRLETRTKVGQALDVLDQLTEIMMRTFATALKGGIRKVKHVSCQSPILMFVPRSFSCKLCLQGILG